MGGDDSQKLRPWRGAYSSPGHSKPPAFSNINTLAQRPSGDAMSTSLRLYRLVECVRGTCLSPDASRSSGAPPSPCKIPQCSADLPLLHLSRSALSWPSRLCSSAMRSST